MKRYVFIESRSPQESPDVLPNYELLTQLAERGNEVSLFLVQNAVLAARKTIVNNPLDRVLATRVNVMADRFSLKERAISEREKHEAVRSAEIDDLIDLVMSQDNTRVVWH